jgi:hypothetical protein
MNANKRGERVFTVAISAGRENCPSLYRDSPRRHFLLSIRVYSRAFAVEYLAPDSNRWSDLSHDFSSHMSIRERGQTKWYLLQ